MTDIVLRDIDPVLAGRIRELAQARGWSMHDTLLRLIEQGLYQCEEAGAPGQHRVDVAQHDVGHAGLPSRLPGCSLPAGTPSIQTTAAFAATGPGPRRPSSRHSTTPGMPIRAVPMKNSA
jgi:hypothetical protein